LLDEISVLFCGLKKNELRKTRPARRIRPMIIKSSFLFLLGVLGALMIDSVS